MRTRRGFHISCSRQSVALAAAFVIAAGAVLPVFAQLSRAGTGEVIAVRELQLKAGVDTAQFERFVRDRYNPGWESAVPGLKAYIGKADRGAQKGSYALLLVFDGEKTRDAIFPKEGGGASPAFAPLLKGPFALNQELEKYLEPGSLSVYTDYVAMR
jgi:hypothetical protein